MVKKTKKISPEKSNTQRTISSYFASSGNPKLFATVGDVSSKPIQSHNGKQTQMSLETVGPRRAPWSSKLTLSRASKTNSQGLTGGSSSNSAAKSILNTPIIENVIECLSDDESSDSLDIIPPTPQAGHGNTSPLSLSKCQKDKYGSPLKIESSLMHAADSSFDSEKDVIQNTPESKASTFDSDCSPDVIPPTPQTSRQSSMSSSLNLPKLSSHKLPKSSLSLLSSRSLQAKMNLKNSLRLKPISLKKKFSHKKISEESKIEALVPLANKEDSIRRTETDDNVTDEKRSSNDSGKENTNLLKNPSLKRPAAKGTGISPDPKRAIVLDDFAKPIDTDHCKSNLLGKFNLNSPTVSGSESDSSFSMLQESLHSLANSRIQFSTDKRKLLEKSGIACATDVVDRSFTLEVPNEGLIENLEISKAEEKRQDSLPHEIFGNNGVNEKETTIVPEIQVEFSEELFNPSQGISTESISRKECIKEKETCFNREKDSKDGVELFNPSQGFSPKAISKAENIKEKETCFNREKDSKEAVELFNPSQGFSPEAISKTESSKEKETCFKQEKDSKDDIDEYAFDDDLALDFENMSPFKEQQPTALPEPENKAVKKILNEGVGRDSFASRGDFGRHIVTKVEHLPYRGEILLHVTSLREKLARTCSLRGFWSQSAISEGDIVHILFAEFQDGHCTIDNAQGLLVINPDYLISGTSVVSAVFCRRKSVLSERFRGIGSGNKIMLVGSLTHQLFQSVVKDKITSQQRLEALAKQFVSHPKILRDMYGLGVSESEILEEIHKYLECIHSWSQRYLGNKDLRVDKTKSERKSQWRGNIVEIQDIEESVWSPKYGVKGKIDLTVKTHNRGVSKVVPLELKTGRSSFSAEHKGQVTLYSMMSGDRREDPQSGLLLYLKDGSMEEVPAGEKEKRGLIQLRNEMIRYLTASPVAEEGSLGLKPPSLPEPISFEKACRRCDYLLTCAVYQKGIEDVTPDPSHPMGSLVPEMTGHLPQSHLDYFRLWCLLLHLEISVNKKDSVIRALWCQDAIKRESSGDCLSSLILDPSQSVQDLDGVFLHTFVRSPTSTSSVKLEDVGLQNAESIVVSSQSEIALSLGVLSKFKNGGVTVVLDRNLKEYPNWRSKIFTVDRCEYQNTMNINFSNLANLLVDCPRATTLRSLIIDKQTPSFKSGLPEEILTKGKHILRRLNKTQKRAVLKTLTAEDYSLLKGFPGTGKTSTIVALVELMVALGHSVLLTSYTHSAVDNILLKLKSVNVNFLRLGKVSRIHPDLLSYTDERKTKSIKDVSSLSKFYDEQLVVATTCLGMNHVLFSKRTFDFCIVDEASQVLQAAALGPLFHSSRFVLVGDPKQLPPVIQSSQAKDLGMEESLFVRLDSTGATCCLTEQYRMNGQIMKLANLLMYEGQLQCASAELETKSLDLPLYEENIRSSDEADWIKRVLDPGIDHSVVFLDTCGGAPHELESGKMIVNRREMTVVLTLIQMLLKAGLSAEDVGVITPYRAQVKYIRTAVTKEMEMGHRVEVNTVDQYQGRDKSVIIYSCVRSGLTKEDGGILQDKRRLNVAITRAKYKLLMVGDIASLKSYNPFQKLISFLDKSSQVYQMKEGVDGFHWLDPES